MTQNQQPNLHSDIKHFLEVYKVLSSQGKAHFEAQMAASIKKQDDRTKKLYLALLQAAKDGKETEEAIEAMQKAAA
jgi:hypothetical protein